MERYLSLGLVRFVQFIAVVFYTYIAFIYFGGVFLLPLAGIYHLSNILGCLGLNAFLATLLGIGIVGGAIYLGYRIPKFFLVIRDFGLNLIAIGFNQIKEFGCIAERMKNSANSHSVISEKSG